MYEKFICLYLLLVLFISDAYLNLIYIDVDDGELTYYYKHFFTHRLMMLDLDIF